MLVEEVNGQKDHNNTDYLEAGHQNARREDDGTDTVRSGLKKINDAIHDGGKILLSLVLHSHDRQQVGR